LFLVGDVLVGKRIIVILFCSKVVVSDDAEVFLGFSV